MTALQGIIVLERSCGVAGALCGLQLADAGATVIRIESPAGDRNHGPHTGSQERSTYQMLHRDKLSIVIDTSRPGGERAFEKMIQGADVLIEDSGSCPHSSLQRTSWERASALNQALIYVSIAPSAGVEEFETLGELEVQGLTGHMAFLGQWGSPPVRCGADIAYLAGGMHAFIGATAALFSRESSGLGQKVDVSLVTSLLSVGSHWLADFSNPDQYSGGVTDPYSGAEQGYKCKDGNITFGFIGRRNDKRDPWARLCQALGLDELLSDEWMAEHGSGYVGAGQDAQAFRPLIEQATSHLSRAEVMDIVWGIGGAGAPIMTYEELYGQELHPQIEATGVVSELGDGRRVVLSPWAANKRIGRQDHEPTPPPGANTREVLDRFGFDDEQIKNFQSTGVIK